MLAAAAVADSSAWASSALIVSMWEPGEPTAGAIQVNEDRSLADSTFPNRPRDRAGRSSKAREAWPGATAITPSNFPPAGDQ